MFAPALMVCGNAQAQATTATPSVEELEKQLERKQSEQKKPAARPLQKKKESVEAPADSKRASNSEESYLFGLTFGEQLRSIGLGTESMAVGELNRGINDGLSGKKPSSAERERVKSFAKASQEQLGAQNKLAGRQFLEKNGRESGVKTTSSGLQYQIMAMGDLNAASPTPSDKVTVQYRGKLIDGTEFDSSYASGKPVTFMVNSVIKGWREALVLMKPGAKWRLFVPPELAYGSSPRPEIPAESVLIFDVELLNFSR